MEIEVTFFNQLKMLIDLIVVSILFLILLFLINVIELKWGYFILISYLVFFFFPVLLLHINYLKENLDNVFIVESNVIINKNSLEKLKYTSEEICEIIFFMNGSKGTVNGTLAFSNYYYAKIELLDGSSFVITSLCSNKIDKILRDNFKNVEIRIEKVFYPMINQ
ncbi:hypothetical protein ACHRVW_00785 [Flavobacterium collinsii]|jgi:hypothetical protein|uniref:PH domain-containing protein n=1 Tax=Flavobacterium collinsii TaxID=1114861 RepID=A0A9W4TD97_9FLAO|nr:hypothetical protein [Flavobacterium collinsii]CAA9195520.1 hypothetical protein FLACOL7796_00656 [Flavobacterium collinsii]CAI2765857.1 conserved protein of unknown function [Flavobacterium collinsii]